MKILLTGAAGQLGQELYPRLAALGEVSAIDLSACTQAERPWSQLDMANEGQLEILLNRLQADLVVNAAAYTAVDQAERDTEIAFAVNARVPGRLARWAERNGRALLHYSTDYIFDGRLDRPYRETDEPAPVNSYGESKFAGERAIRASGCRHVILRSSWIYSMHGKNFVLTMLELARRNLRLRVVGDQAGCPTWARNLADYSIQVIRSGLVGRKTLPQGTYHCCDRDGTSWYDFASLVFATGVRLGMLDSVPELEEVSSDDYPQVARRPRWSVLDTSALSNDVGIQPAALKPSLEACMKEININE